MRGVSPKTLQYLMGHSDINVTLNVYTHIDFEGAKENLDRVKSEMNKVKKPRKRKVENI